MKKALIAVLLLLSSLLLWQCSKEGTAEQKSKVSDAIPVQTMELQPRPFAEYLQITGTTEARNRIKIVVEEGGTLNKVLIDQGNFAKAGDTLAILTNRVLKAGFQEARAALHQAELDFNSKKVLYGKRAISENEFLASQYNWERAKAAYELAKARYSKLFITAPLNGYVNDRLYDLGAYATPMTPIFDFLDNAYMKITAGVAERFLNDIKIGTPAEITFDAYPDIKMNSEVSFITRSIDPMNRTFQIEIQIPNPDRKLAPQMIADLKLLRRSYENQIVIPLDALVESEQGRFVFVSSNGQAKKIPVDLKAVYEDSVVVENLEPNQRLVILGQQELTEGDTLFLTEN